MNWLEKVLDKLGLAEEDIEIEVEREEANKYEDSVYWYSGGTVNEIVNRISSAKNVGAIEALRGIYDAEKDGKIRIVDPSPPTTFVSYLGSLYCDWFWVAMAIMGVTVFSIYLLPQSYPLVVLRYVSGAVFILFIPGFVLIEALYPKADELERLERFALDIGLSLAVVPLVGLVLNYTPWGIRLDPILVSICALVLILGVIGVLKKYSIFKLGLTLVKR